MEQIPLGNRKARTLALRAELAERLGIPPDHLRTLSVESLQTALERVVALEREAASAQTDQLTGLPLRKGGTEVLNREVARANRMEGPGPHLLIAYIDVNDLKKANDTGGHDAGDLLIRSVAEALTTRLRPYDVAIRWGGDEFVCALPGITEEAARILFKEVNRDVGERCGGSISFGLAMHRRGDTPEIMLTRADGELYAAKREHHAGRGVA